MVTRSEATRSMTGTTSKTAWGMMVAPRRTHANKPDFNPAVWKKG